VARRRYHPYGAERYVAGTLLTDVGYTGQRDVPGTGLMHYGARYYHPALGRFVSADTMVPEAGNPQALNRYAYVKNNPLRHVDPDGHTPLLVTAVIGAGIGAAVNLGYQTVPILLKGGSVKNAFEQVEWAQVAGAAAGGAVMGLTMGAGAAVLGTSLGATAVSGAVSGVVGGQTGRFTEAAISETIEHGNLDRERVWCSAQENGFGEPASMIVDAGTGAAAGVIGHGTNRLLQGVGAIPRPAQGFAQESYGVRFDIRGNAHTVSDAIVETSRQQSTFTVLYWEIEQGLVEEFTQVEMGNLFAVFQPN